MEKGITVKKEENFSEWFTQLMIKADLSDYTQVSGCIVFKPRAWSIWENIVELINKELKKLDVKNVYFPLFIPESLLKKEKDFISGFSPEVAWVTQTGDTKLQEKLAVRPTSEAIMYDSFSKWIRSHRDLPLKYNQWSNVVRWEFKHPIPLLRTREFWFNEGHTVFATKQEAEAEQSSIIKMYEKITKDYMALPSLIGKKTDKEKFAGAEYTVSMEFYMPNGRAIQGPDFHHDGQNFAKAYNIKFLDEKKEKQYVYQNTWAISTRMLGVMFAIHSDEKGLIIPPKIAQEKIVIVPILFENTKQKILKKANEIKKKLKKFSPILDDREEYSPGFKFNEWELKGIPIRVEIGPKDLEKNSVILVRRDTNQKKSIKIAILIKEIEKELEDIQKNLFNRAKNLLDSNIAYTKNFDELKEAIKNKKIAKAPWCGSRRCEDSIKEKTNGVKSLNIPLKQSKIKDKCVYCGKKAKIICYFGKSY